MPGGHRDETLGSRVVSSTGTLAAAPGEAARRQAPRLLVAASPKDQVQVPRGGAAPARAFAQLPRWARGLRVVATVTHQGVP